MHLIHQSVGKPFGRSRPQNCLRQLLSPAVTGFCRINRHKAQVEESTRSTPGRAPAHAAPEWCPIVASRELTRHIVAYGLRTHDENTFDLNVKFPAPSAGRRSEPPWDGAG